MAIAFTLKVFDRRLLREVLERNIVCELGFKPPALPKKAKTLPTKLRWLLHIYKDA